MPVPGRILYRGASALLAGSTASAFLRAGVSVQAAKLIASLDPEHQSDGGIWSNGGQLSSGQIMGVGMITGLVETSVLLPFENVKTNMIERTLPETVLKRNFESDMLGAHTAPPPPPPPAPTSTAPPSTQLKKSKTVRPKAAHSTPSPQIHLRAGQNFVPLLKVNSSAIPTTLLSTVREMYATRGFSAFNQGFSPTLFRTFGHTSVALLSFQTIRQLVHPLSNDPLPVHLSLIAGVVSGALVVATTQPLDVIKTRMQSVNARGVYRSFPGTIYRIFVEEGWKTLWSGGVPRAVTVIGGGMIAVPM